MPTPTAGWAATPSRGGPSRSSAGRSARRPGSAVGTMPAGSVTGTYVLAQRPGGATEYRAVFSTPSSEGINGDSSPAVRVDVTGCAAASPRRRVGDPGPMRLIRKGVAPMSRSTVRRPALAILADRAAGWCVRGRRVRRARRRRARPRRAAAADGRRRASAAPSPSATASPSATEPPAATLAVEGGDPVTGQLGTFTWGDGGSDSPWLPGSPIAVGTGEHLTVSHRAVGVGGGHLVRQTGPRRDDRRAARERPVSERAARRSPSTPRRPGRGRSR